MTYKVKPKQYITNPAKQPQYFFYADYIVLNLNACFPKKGNYLKFLNCLKELKGLGTKLNLCNLASLCYKLQIPYASQETLDFVQKLVNYIKQDTDFVITQDNITSFGEIDMKPFSYLISHDNQNNIVYTNSTLVDCLKILGFVDTQLFDILDYTKNLVDVIPPDLINELPIATKTTLGCYEMIKEILCLQDTSHMKN